jgi:hypothetical protein
MHGALSGALEGTRDGNHRDGAWTKKWPRLGNSPNHGTARTASLSTPAAEISQAAGLEEKMMAKT